jgi:hypothetical protein
MRFFIAGADTRQHASSPASLLVGFDPIGSGQWEAGVYKRQSQSHLITYLTA